MSALLQVEHLSASGAGQVGAGLQNGHDIVRYRQLAKYRGFLGQVAEAGAGTPVYGQAGDILTVDEHRATIGGDQACDHVETSGFACAVGAQKPNNLIGFNGHGDVDDNLTRLIALGQVVCFECGHGLVFALAVVIVVIAVPERAGRNDHAHPLGFLRVTAGFYHGLSHIVVDAVAGKTGAFLLQGCAVDQV